MPRPPPALAHRSSPRSRRRWCTRAADRGSARTSRRSSRRRATDTRSPRSRAAATPDSRRPARTSARTCRWRTNSTLRARASAHIQRQPFVHPSVHPYPYPIHPPPTHRLRKSIDSTPTRDRRTARRSTRQPLRTRARARRLACALAHEVPTVQLASAASVIAAARRKRSHLTAPAADRRAAAPARPAHGAVAAALRVVAEASRRRSRRRVGIAALRASAAPRATSERAPAARVGDGASDSPTAQSVMLRHVADAHVATAVRAVVHHAWPLAQPVAVHFAGSGSVQRSHTLPLSPPLSRTRLDRRQRRAARRTSSQRTTVDKGSFDTQLRARARADSGRDCWRRRRRRRRRPQKSMLRLRVPPSTHPWRCSSARSRSARRRRTARICRAGPLHTTGRASCTCPPRSRPCRRAPVHTARTGAAPRALATPQPGLDRRRSCRDTCRWSCTARRDPPSCSAPRAARATRRRRSRRRSWRAARGRGARKEFSRWSFATSATTYYIRWKTRPRRS